MHRGTHTTHAPWNHWFHVDGWTYGTWLPGDPKGFRTRHHREHVEGDYKNPPPPGIYEQRHARATQLLQRPPVILSPQARAIALEAMLDSFRIDDVLVAAICVGAKHYHILAKFPYAQRHPHPHANTDPKAQGLCPWAFSVRDLVGRAKRRSARALTRAELAAPGGIWATRCRALPIKDRAHQLNTARYIARHTQEGAACWTCAHPLPTPSNFSANGPPSRHPHEAAPDAPLSSFVTFSPKT